MLYLVVSVIDNPDDCSSVLEAWERVGVSGATILESTGLARIKRAGMRDDISIMPSLRDLLHAKEERHRTIFTVVDSQETIDSLVDVTQSVIGNFDQENTGFLFVVPVAQVYGLRGVNGKDHRTEPGQ